MYLDSRLPSPFHFIGTRFDEGQPIRGDWQYHNGYGGYSADPLSNPDRSVLRRLVDGGVIDKIGKPDVILLHIGTNTIGDSDPATSEENYTGSNSDKADAQLYRMLDYLGKALPTTKIILAQIIPKVDTGGGGQLLADTFQYNYGDTNGKGGIPGVLSKLATSISRRITLADMFRMDLHGTRLDYLIGDYRVDPDGDGIVDWAKNFNESSFYSAFGNTGWNEYLYVDGTHPTALGYQIMAEAWYQGMRAAGIVSNPTPSAVAAGLALIALAAGRRRRPA